jgi:hypothetical protein
MTLLATVEPVYILNEDLVRNNLDIDVLVKKICCWSHMCMCGAMRCGSIAHRGRNDLVSFACGDWPGRVGL